MNRSTQLATRIATLEAQRKSAAMFGHKMTAKTLAAQIKALKEGKR